LRVRAEPFIFILLWGAICWCITRWSVYVPFPLSISFLLFIFFSVTLSSYPFYFIKYWNVFSL
jgi:hypothetical protein